MSSPPAGPSPADSGELAPGTLVADRYEILRPLGTGGMGSVYLARHRHMGRTCALKVIAPRLVRDREAIDRFTREARNASRIQHPSVCTVYDSGVTAEGLVYLAMEYLEGRTLGSLLAEQGALPPPRASRIVSGIAAGLEAAHALGIVHRDLKPENIMVREDQQDQVKLLDFGISKAAADPGGEVTAAGVVVGTPDYMAPEQFAGDPVDRRADVYSLGLVAYRMVSGALPHRAGTSRESLARRLTEPPDPVSRVAAHLGSHLDASVARALARDPDERFPSAMGFASAFADAAAQAPGTDGETVLLEQATARIAKPWPTAGRSRLTRVVFATAAGAVVVALAAIAYLRPLDEIPPQAAGPSPEVAVNGNDSSAAAGAGAAQPERSPVPPPVAPAIPPLPEVAEIADPDTRDASRARAEHIYGLAAAGPTLRAQAALLVAQAHLEEARLDSAESWGERALLMNDQAPRDAAQAERRSRYERFLTQVRGMRKEPTVP